jgi:2-amino-4-hydroxy-6-hydroxymethyldihydropteridine diphosphokinase
MNNSYLLIGGNEGDRPGRMAEARREIGRTAGSILRSSSLYETAAWGKTDQADFINQALLLQTALDAPDLMLELLAIEARMGRRREGKWGPRTIDIDILFFNDDIISLPGLSIPHPELPKRRFALVPLEEIAPDQIHPVSHRSVRELLAACPDHSDVKKIVTVI